MMLRLTFLSFISVIVICTTFSSVRVSLEAAPKIQITHSHNHDHHHSDDQAAIPEKSENHESSHSHSHEIVIITLVYFLKPEISADRLITDQVPQLSSWFGRSPQSPILSGIFRPPILS